MVGSDINDHDGIDSGGAMPSPGVPGALQGGGSGGNVVEMVMIVTVLGEGGSAKVRGGGDVDEVKWRRWLFRQGAIPHAFIACKPVVVRAVGAGKRAHTNEM